MLQIVAAAADVVVLIARHICNGSGFSQSYFIIFYQKLLIIFVHNSCVTRMQFLVTKFFV
jgi:hypothetical protein